MDTYGLPSGGIKMARLIEKSKAHLGVKYYTLKQNILKLQEQANFKMLNAFELHALEQLEIEFKKVKTVMILKGMEIPV
jgi:hypothetical protein